MLHYDPYSWKVQDDPYPFYKLLRNECPAYFVEQRNLWVITRYADCLAALQNPAAWSSAAGNIIDDSIERVGHTMGTTDPPRHEELRRLVTKAFTPASVTRLEPLIRRTVLDLISTFIHERTCDFTGQFAGPLTASIVGYMLGVPQEDHALLRLWTEAAVQRPENTYQEQGETEEHEKALKKLIEYIAEMIKTKRRIPQDDLISNLIAVDLAANQEVRITDATMIGAAFIGAAFESTNLMLGNALVALSLHPDQRIEVREDPSLIAGMIEEALRWDPSTQGFARTTTRDIMIEDTMIPAGSQVFIAFGAANRDERQFPDPERFDIHRKITHHFGFGWGIHICLGAPLARLEMKVAFEELLPRLVDYDVDLVHARRSRGPQFRGYQVLPISF